MKSVKRTQQRLILTFRPISAWLCCIISVIGGILIPYPWCLFWFIPSTTLNLFILFFADSVNCYFDKSKNQFIQQTYGIRGTRVVTFNLSDISGVFIENLSFNHENIYLIYLALDSCEKFYLTRWKYANLIGIQSSVNYICEFLELPTYK